MDAPFSAMIVVLWFCLIICISLFGLGKCLLSVHVFVKQSFCFGLIRIYMPKGPAAIAAESHCIRLHLENMFSECNLNAIVTCHVW